MAAERLSNEDVFIGIFGMFAGLLGIGLIYDRLERNHARSASVSPSAEPETVFKLPDQKPQPTEKVPGRSGVIIDLGKNRIRIPIPKKINPGN